MSFLATTGGIRGEDVRDLMVAAVEHRFGRVNRLPLTIEWLSDNGSCYISFARDIGLVPRTTPIESPQSNGMAEAFVRTIKRDYVRVSPCPNAQTVMHQLSSWIIHYNEFTRTRLSDIVRPVSSSQLAEIPDRVRSFGGYNTCCYSVRIQDARVCGVSRRKRAYRFMFRPRRIKARTMRSAGLLPHCDDSIQTNRVVPSAKYAVIGASRCKWFIPRTRLVGKYFAGKTLLIDHLIGDCADLVYILRLVAQL